MLTPNNKFCNKNSNNKLVKLKYTIFTISMNFLKILTTYARPLQYEPHRNERISKKYERRLTRMQKIEN